MNASHSHLPVTHKFLTPLFWGSLWLVFPGLASAADARTVQPVQFSSSPEVTRVIIGTGGKVQYRAERLSNPDRVYFDLKGDSFSGKQNELITVGDNLLKRIRIAPKDATTLRIVLDLQRSVRFVTSQFRNPNSFVIELRPLDPLTVSPAPTPLLPVLPSAPVFPAAAPTPSGVAMVSSPSTANPERFAPCVEVLNSPTEPAKKNQNGRRSLTRALGLKISRVIVDAGHGGDDTGAISCNGLMEKELVLDVARRLGQLIEEKLDCEVIYTRTEDTSMALRARSDLAREKDADLFVSIHANWSATRAAAGFETYYLNFTNRERSREVAARENAAASESVHELENLVQKIARSEKLRESGEFAASVQSSLYRSLARKNSVDLDRGVKQAPFLVLIGTRVPSILVEIGFLSNPQEERLLHQSEHRQRIADALCLGVAQYIGSLSHLERRKPGISESSNRSRTNVAGN